MSPEKYGELAIDEGLVGWAASFMSGQAIRMAIDGHEGEEIGIMTGLADLPMLLVIYGSGVHSHVESRCQMANILFVDAVTWIASDSKLNAVGLVSP